MLFVAFFSVYAWKNWFVSLCAAIALMAVTEHPDFPKGIAGIPGMNPWNILIANVVAAWFVLRGRSDDPRDFPGVAKGMLWCFVIVVLIGVGRLASSTYPTGFDSSYLITELIINTLKWFIPGLLLFDACRTRERAVIALGVILLLYFLFSVQVIRWMPVSEVASSGNDLSSRASKITQNEIGYNRVTLSMMLAGASWAALATMPLLRKNSHRVALFVVSCSIIMGQALTGGRTGYVTWVAIGVALASLRWRKLLMILPVAVAVIFATVPSVRERMFQGMGGKEGNFTVETSEYEMTSGRDIAWPIVIDEIWESPLIGYGRQAMVSTGARDYLMDNFNESFPHPHQAYLEQLLDNGVIGFLFVMPIYFYVWFKSIPLLLERRDPLVCAIGCTAFCLVSALLIGAFGGQTFYPREGSVGMWAAIGLMLRVSVQRNRALLEGTPVFPDRLTEEYFFGDESRGGEMAVPGFAPQTTVV